MKTVNKIIISATAILVILAVVGLSQLQEEEIIQNQESVIIPNEFIVTFYETTGLVSGMLEFENIEVGFESLQPFTNTNQVFLVKTDESNLSVILSDPRVQYIEPNRLYHLTGISNGMPFGIDRIEADLRANMGDGIDDALDVDIAVMDTGIQQNPSNPDMRIVNCVFFISSTSCADTNGHGSHVSGTIAAKDNGGNNIVGVAEGARIHMLKVCPAGCPASDLISAADWVTARADIIEVVNMSLGGFQVVNDPSCNPLIPNAWQQSLCRVYQAGVIIVVAAGNSNVNADNFVPCAWDSVICVSAMRDDDGMPGGFGGINDDKMASFSNFGESIDIIAPGVQVLSYNHLGQLWKISGTSMASPHVAGAAALATLDFLNPTNAAEVELVRDFLIAQGFPRDGPNGWTNDKDNFAEPLVQVAFGDPNPPPPPPPPPPPAMHDLTIDAFSAKPIIVNQGDIINLQATISNSGTVDEVGALIDYIDATTSTLIARQFPIPLVIGETVIGDIQQWNTTGVAVGDHLITAEARSEFIDENPLDNELSVTITIRSADSSTPVLTSVTTIDGQSISAIWTNEVPVTAGHDIFINGLDTNETWRTDNLFQTISGLEPNTEYCIKIQARYHFIGVFLSNELCTITDPVVPCDAECVQDKRLDALEAFH